MQYRTLGKTGLKVSVIGMGTWQLGGEWGKTFTQGEVDALFRRGKDLGINLVDTAECYGDHVSESLVGKAIAGQRKDWIVCTKFGHRYTGFMKRTDERDLPDVREQLDASLRALRTDYIDVYQYHSVRDNEFDNPSLWDFLQKAKKAGKIRHIGNSIASSLDLRFQTEKSTQAGVEVLQVVYNRLERKPEAEAFPEAEKQELGVLARVPLASGFLSGKYKPGVKFTGNDTRATQDQAKIDEKLKTVEGIRKLELPPGVDMAQWALAWCLKHPAVSAVIPGCKDIDQVEKNARAAELVGTI
jgi:aryl-alcohol dehydrogenase-like predicted oxidoreductase